MSREELDLCTGEEGCASPEHVISCPENGTSRTVDKAPNDPRTAEQHLANLVAVIQGFELGVEMAHEQHLAGDQGDYMRGARDMASAVLNWIEEPDQAFAIIRARYSDDAGGLA